MSDTKPAQPLGLVSSAQLGQAPKRASTCGLTECRDKTMCVRCERIEDQAAMSALLPDGVSWGDNLTPEIVRELLAAERERYACLCEQMALYTGVDCASAIRRA